MMSVHPHTPSAPFPPSRGPTGHLDRVQSALLSVMLFSAAAIAATILLLMIVL
jgi:hypothetical protein